MLQRNPPNPLKQKSKGRLRGGGAGRGREVQPMKDGKGESKAPMESDQRGARGSEFTPASSSKRNSTAEQRSSSRFRAFAAKAQGWGLGPRAQFQQCNKAARTEPAS